jgi:hypothetical protein
LFQKQDIFSGEDLYEKHFTFQETTPINERFEEFGIGDKNFIMNSGSYLIMQLLIVVWHFVGKYLFKLCVKFARIPFFRRVGMMITPPDIQNLKIISIKLMLETYFDLAICTFINI